MVPIISYLRLIQNQSDNLSLQRIINEPKRGIGQTSMEKIETKKTNKNIRLEKTITFPLSRLQGLISDVILQSPTLSV